MFINKSINPPPLSFNSRSAISSSGQLRRTFDRNEPIDLKNIPPELLSDEPQIDLNLPILWKPYKEFNPVHALDHWDLVYNVSPIVNLKLGTVYGNAEVPEPTEARALYN